MLLFGRMIWKIWVLLLAALASTSRLYAETAVVAFRQSLKGTQYYLRDYSADHVTQYVWDNGRLTSAIPELRSFGPFKPYRIELNGHIVRIDGDSATISRDSKTGKLRLGGVFSKALTIDLGNSDPDEVLPKLSSLLFFGDAASARDGLPERIVRALNEMPSASGKADKCKCVHALVAGTTKELPLQGHTYRKADLTKRDDLYFTDAARHAQMTGTATLGFFVGTNGTATDVWVLRSLGYGLDQEAARALRASQFNPATYDGRPVAVETVEDATFRSWLR